MSGLERNSYFCFPESPDVSRDEVEGNIRTGEKTKLTGFQKDLTLSVFLYFYRLFCSCFSFCVTMLIFQIKRIISSEKWFNYVVIFSF